MNKSMVAIGAMFLLIAPLKPVQAATKFEKIEVKLAERNAIDEFCDEIEDIYSIFDINSYPTSVESLTGLVMNKDVKFTIKSIGEEYAYCIDQDNKKYAIDIEQLPVGAIEKSTMTIESTKQKPMVNMPEITIKKLVLTKDSVKKEGKTYKKPVKKEEKAVIEDPNAIKVIWDTPQKPNLDIDGVN